LCNELLEFFDHRSFSSYVTQPVFADGAQVKPKTGYSPEHN
jgi:hypothetical protein